MQRWAPGAARGSGGGSRPLPGGPDGGSVPTVGSELSADQRAQMEGLLRRFHQVLTATPGTAKVGVHRINTEPGWVVQEAHRPLPRKVWDTVRQEVQLMKQWGVIEESRSKWRSPIILVPKRDGSVRFCIDFRKVNGISQFDAYPMPRVEELLECLGRARYISTLDLSKGYWQIPLDPQDRKKTAFATPFGLFQFRRMPFGLHGAAATFQRAMDQVLRPMKGYAAAYIDDIAVYSMTWPEHLPHLEAVMRALEEAGLTANPKECHLAQREVSYLGYTVGGGRLKPLLDKVEALRSYPPPATKRQVRGFLGLAGYYRRFVPDFATIAAPMTELTKDVHPNKVQWTTQPDQAFRELKRRLVQAPVLRQPDFEKLFSLYTDASECGIGAVLAQDHEGEEHPVLYLSRKLLPRERNYATIEKEALAVKWAIETLRYYFMGQ
uniref:ribonuclease H n=1 Tax=Pelodiscus sinensis TaxID=13735 RepID=K7EX57_PELSI